jgi:putative hemolysin
VGITSIGMLNGIIGEAAFSDGLAHWLRGVGVPESASGVSATAIVVAVITFITIVFGELVPKRIGQLYPETVSRLIARPMTWVASAAKPFVRLLSASTQAVLTLLRVNDSASRLVTEEEIVASLEEGRDAGVIEFHEHQMVQNVFRLDERSLTSLMVPRSDVQWLDADLSLAEGLRLSADGQEKGSHSWYPVCRGSLDDVVGVISVARMLALGADAEGKLGEHALPAAFLPETLSGMELLDQLRARSGRMVFVVDEYGVVQGIMTPREDGSWLLDGLMPVSELKARLDIRDLPEEDRGRYNTIAGLLMAETGRLPAVGERIACAGWIFEIVDLDGKRIDKVLAEKPVHVA